MDTAGSELLASALGSQAACLSLQEEQLSSLSRGVKGLAYSQDEFTAAVTAQIGGLTEQIQQLLGASKGGAPEPPAPEPSPVPTFVYGPGVRLASPERYSGDIGRCKSLLIDCDMHFELSPYQFHTDRAKVAYIISHLAGRAKAWATAEWDPGSRICCSIQEFKEGLRKTFDPVTADREKAKQLCGLRQGKEPLRWRADGTPQHTTTFS